MAGPVPERDPLELFHPVVATWFRERFPAGPTPCQAEGWPAIAAGRDTLIAAPTGSGKTLAGFLVAIDRCYRFAAPTATEDHRCRSHAQAPAQAPAQAQGTRVVYVSPLRALTVDIAENLIGPLEEMAAIATRLGLVLPRVRVGVRNGDTPASARAAMLRDPPEILVTTPESLYLLLTAAKGRRLLSSTETVIVDEIHALARDKRGVHLALSLERLDRLCRLSAQEAVGLPRHAASLSADATGSSRLPDSPGSLEPGSPAPAGDLAEPTGEAEREELSKETSKPARAPRPVRIGLSATQRPLSVVSRLLVGSPKTPSDQSAEPRCSVVDTGHLRDLDIAVELPRSPLEAVASNEQFAAVIDLLAEKIEAHHTTLIFVNTRRLAERVAHLLGQRLGDGAVASHHGSLSFERRHKIEGLLRAGELRALVATASLELGIDVGPIDLVCQLGSPRSIATFLQRVGRANHRLSGVPKGRCYPLTRDELVECVALFGGVLAGELDAIVPAVAPLDILAQQIVAECAASGEMTTSELYEQVRGAAPYRDLSPETFESVLDLVTDGVITGRGRRGSYLFRDRVEGVVRPRRGARLAALTSGGAIPPLADYRVVLDPEGVTVGTVNEDWAIEAMAGDVFLLGTNSWRILSVAGGIVRVSDAGNTPPTLPFWLGEAPARTTELSELVSELRRGVDSQLAGDRDAPHTGAESATARIVAFIRSFSGVSDEAARQVADYLATARQQLGAMPSSTTVVFERFFDDTGGMQLVVHSPFGARINRGLGLSLRKRFCRSFDFELQAAANDDAIVLSLGPQHSFPLDEVQRYVSAASVEDVLVQAVLPTPIFGARWRWNLSRSLIAPRFRGSRELPPAIQRMEADDLMAAIFPMLAACQENVSGPIEIPDHPIVHQTLRDCMTEAMDLAGLQALLGAMADGSIEVRVADTTEPSLLAHEILSGRPYTFLDDAPLEERRTRAVTLGRGLPLEATDLTDLDPEIIARVRREVAPHPRDSDELAEYLETVLLAPALAGCEDALSALLQRGRADIATITGPAGAESSLRWYATQATEDARSLLDRHSTLREERTALESRRAEALVAAVRGHLGYLGPTTARGLAETLGPTVSASEVATALAVLEREGSVLCGHFEQGLDRGDSGATRGTRAPREQYRRAGEGASDDGPIPANFEAARSDEAGESSELQWCARHLLARIHGLSRDQRRRSIEAVSTQTYLRFLLQYQHLTPDSRLEGIGGLETVIGQLQGLEIAVGALEESILPGRILGYHSGLLDDLCLSGVVTWGRCTPRPPDRPGRGPRRGGAVPSRATPITLARREDMGWLLAAARGEAAPEEPAVGAAREVIDLLRERGALFFAEIVEETARLPEEVVDGLWDSVARGLVTADAFSSVRALLKERRPGSYRSDLHGSGSRRLGAYNPTAPRWRSGRSSSIGAGRSSSVRHSAPAPRGGRWSLLSRRDLERLDRHDLADAVADQMLRRWGVLCYELFCRESCALSWREVLTALRRLEARGQVRGGRLIAGLMGEQFGLVEAVEALRRVERTPLDGSPVTICGADPANLTGILAPGPRLAATRGTRLTLVDGLPVRAPSPAPPPRRARRTKAQLR